MKLVKSNTEAFSFKYNSATILDVTKEGIVVSDEVAKVMQDRLPVTVEDAEEGSVPAEVVDSTPAIPVIDPLDEVIPPAPEVPLSANE